MRTHTICRPRLATMPDFPGATLAYCPDCGLPCWRTPQEPDPLPDGYGAACTVCALNRAVVPHPTEKTS